MEKRKRKVYKLKLGKGTRVKIEVRSNLVLPRALRPLCSRSLLRKVLKTPENIILAFLSVIALGFEIEHAARRYPTLLITEGLGGVSRVEREREAYLQRRIIMQLKRRRLIEEQYLGNKIIYKLSLRGETDLLKRKLRALCRNAGVSKKKCVVIFDIPESERLARDTLRQFLKECGFCRIQKSVWCASEAVIPDLEQVILDLGIRKWVRVLKAELVA